MDNKRAKNFTDYDKNILFEIVQKFRHIVENKKTDATNVKEKNDSWNKICNEYNSLFLLYFTTNTK